MIGAGIACRPLAQRRVRNTARKYCAARSRVNGGVLAGVPLERRGRTRRFPGWARKADMR